MEDLFGDKNNGADFSECGKYRYRLYRIWNDKLPIAMVIGLNPSTANSDKNDATINILRSTLFKLGYGGFYMMNCWAYISTDPEKLRDHRWNELICDWNDNMITATASRCQDIIFAWGTFPIVKETGRDKELIEMFPNAKCFGINADGSPYHPRAMIYKKGVLANPQLIKYDRRES